MVSIMTDSKVLDRIIENATREGLWVDEIMFENLRLAVKGEGNEIVISEPAAERQVDVRAINFVTLALWDPQWAFSQIRSEAPNNGEDLIKSTIGLVNSPTPQIRESEYDVCRTNEYIEGVAELAATLVNDSREDNYVYRVYRLLADSERHLSIGVNPLGRQVREFYGRLGPVRIDTDDPDAKGEDPEVKSAAEASW